MKKTTWRRLKTGDIVKSGDLLGLRKESLQHALRDGIFASATAGAILQNDSKAWRRSTPLPTAKRKAKLKIMSKTNLKSRCCGADIFTNANNPKVQPYYICGSCGRPTHPQTYQTPPEELPTPLKSDSLSNNKAANLSTDTQCVKCGKETDMPFHTCSGQKSNTPEKPVKKLAKAFDWKDWVVDWYEYESLEHRLSEANEKLKVLKASTALSNHEYEQLLFAIVVKDAALKRIGELYPEHKAMTDKALSTTKPQTPK